MRSFSALLAVALSVPLSISPTVCCALLVISVVGTPRKFSASLIQWSKMSKIPGSIPFPTSRTSGLPSCARGETKMLGTLSAIARYMFFAVRSWSWLT